MHKLTRIIFEGIPLPRGAIYLDVAANVRHAEEDEEMSIWFWRFTICAGVSRNAASREVAKNVSALLKKLENRAGIFEHIDARLENENPAQLLRDWEESLKIMEAEAGKGKMCHWFGEMDGDATQMLQDLEDGLKILETKAKNGKMRHRVGEMD